MYSIKDKLYPQDFKWGAAPSKTSWGEGMLVMDVGLDADSTATIYVHKDDLDKINKALGIE